MTAIMPCGKCESGDARPDGCGIGKNGTGRGVFVVIEFGRIQPVECGAMTGLQSDL